MKNLCRVLLIFLTLVSWEVAMAEENVDFNSPDKKYQTYRQLEFQVMGLDSMSPDPYIKQMAAISRTFVQLMVDGKQNEASTVYLCPQLEKKYVCRYTEADDTVHVTEFPHAAISLPQNGSLVVQLKTPYKNGMIRFYLGDASQMHQSGYDNVREVQIEKNGKLLIKAEEMSSSPILFAILKYPDEMFYKKYVWVLKRQ